MQRTDLERGEQLKRRLCAKIRAFPFVTLACGLILILPPILLLCYIRAFGVNVIFWDDWDAFPLVQKFMSSRLSFSDLFAQHNEHRMLFPNIVILTIENLTRYDTVPVMLFSWILVCLAGLLIFYVYQKQFHWSSYPKLLLIFLPIMLLLFSFRQWGSILWAFTNQIYLMIFGVVATFSLLEISKKIDVWFVLCILSAILASFSFLVGLAVWPIGLLQIVISERKKMLRDTALWCFVGAIVFISYFWGYIKPAHHPPLNYILTEPFEAVGYFFTIVGAPIASIAPIAETFGIVVALTTALVTAQVYKGRLLGKNRVWLSFVLFAASFSLITTVGRCGFGIEQALSSRYTPITILGTIGLYFLALSVFEKLPAKSKSFGALALLSLIFVEVVVIYGVGCYTGWHAGQYTKYRREMGAYILRTYKIQSDQNIRTFLFWDTTGVRERAAFLEKNGLNVFSEPVINTSTLIPINSDTFFALEKINGKVTSEPATTLEINLSQQETVTILGWAVDKQANDVASGAFIIIDDKNIVPVFYGLDRPDVADRFSNTNFRLSGYVATFSSSILGKGVHSISLKIVSKDGHHYYDQRQVLSLIVD